MAVKVKLFGHAKYSCKIIAGAGACAAGAGDHPRRQMSRRNIGLNRCPQRHRIHAAVDAANGDAHEIVLTNSRHPYGTIYRCVNLCRTIDTQPRRAR